MSSSHSVRVDDDKSSRKDDRLRKEEYRSTTATAPNNPNSNPNPNSNALALVSASASASSSSFGVSACDPCNPCPPPPCDPCDPCNPCQPDPCDDPCKKCKPSSCDVNITVAVPDIEASLTLIEQQLTNSTTFITELVNNPQFIDEIIQNIVNNPDFINSIVNNETFINDLSTSLTTNTEFMNSIVTNISNDPTFITNIANNDEFITQMINNPTFINSIVDNDTIIDQLVNTILDNDTFITELVNNNDFITQLVQNSDFITQITNNPQFITSIVTNITNDDDFIQNIITNITNDDTFIEVLITEITNSPSFYYNIANNPTFITTLVNNTTFINELVNNNTFINTVVTTITSNQTFIDYLVVNITNDPTFITNITNNTTFITKLINNPVFITTLTTNNTFITTMINILTTNTTFINTIIDVIVTSNYFITSLVNNTTFINQLSISLTSNTTFITNLTTNTTFINQLSIALTSNTTFTTNLVNNVNFINQISVQIANNVNFTTTLINNVSFITQLSIALTTNVDFITNLVNNISFVNQLSVHIANNVNFTTTLINNVSFMNQISISIANNVQFITNLVNNVNFTNQLTISLTSNTTFMTSISIAIANNVDFAVTLTNNVNFISKLILKLTTNVDFITKISIALTSNTTFITDLVLNATFQLALSVTLTANVQFIANLVANIDFIAQLSVALTANIDFVLNLIANPVFILNLTATLAISLAANATFVANLTANASFIAQLSVALTANATFIANLTANASFIAQLSVALTANATFIANLVANASFIAQLSVALTADATFIANLTANASFIAQLSVALTANATFIANLVANATFIAELSLALTANATFIANLVANVSFIAQLAVALTADATFIANLIANATFIADLSVALTANATFIANLVANASFITQLSASLTTNTTFVTDLAANATFIAQFTASLIADTSFMTSIANNATFTSTLIANNSFTAGLEAGLAVSLPSNPVFTGGLTADPGFVGGLAGSTSFATLLTQNTTFVTDITAVLSTSLFANTSFMTQLIDLILFYGGGGGGPGGLVPEKTVYVSPSWFPTPPPPSIGAPFFTALVDAIAFVNAQPAGEVWAVVLYPGFYSNTTGTFMSRGLGGLGSGDAALVAGCMSEIERYSKSLAAIAGESEAVMKGFLKKVEKRCDSLSGTRYFDVGVEGAGGVKSFVDFDSVVEDLGLGSGSSDLRSEISSRISGLGLASEGDSGSSSSGDSATGAGSSIVGRIEKDVSGVKNVVGLISSSKGDVDSSEVVVEGDEITNVGTNENLVEVIEEMRSAALEKSRKKTILPSFGGRGKHIPRVVKVNKTCADACDSEDAWHGKLLSRPSRLFPKGVRIGDVKSGVFEKQISEMKEIVCGKLTEACLEFARVVGGIDGFVGSSSGAEGASSSASSASSSSDPKAFSAPPAIFVRPGTHITSVIPGTVIVDYDITWATSTAGPSSLYGGVTNIVTGVQFSADSVLVVDLSGGNGQSVVFDNCRALTGSGFPGCSVTVLGTGFNVREESMFEWCNSSYITLQSLTMVDYTGHFNLRNVHGFSVTGVLRTGVAQEISIEGSSLVRIGTIRVSGGFDWNVNWSSVTIVAQVIDVPVVTVPTNIRITASYALNIPGIGTTTAGINNFFVGTSVVDMTFFSMSINDCVRMTIASSFLTNIQSSGSTIMGVTSNDIVMTNSQLRGITCVLGPSSLGTGTMQILIQNSAFTNSASPGSMFILGGSTHPAAISISGSYVEVFTISGGSATNALSLRTTQCHFESIFSVSSSYTTHFGYSSTFSAGYNVGAVGSATVTNNTVYLDACLSVGDISLVAGLGGGPTSTSLNLIGSVISSVLGSNGSGLVVVVHGCSQAANVGLMSFANPGLSLQISGSFSDAIGGPTDLTITNGTTNSSLVRIDGSSFRNVSITATTNSAHLVQLGKCSFYGTVLVGDFVGYDVHGSSFTFTSTASFGSAGFNIRRIDSSDIWSATLALPVGVPSNWFPTSFTRCLLQTMTDSVPISKTFTSCVINSYSATFSAFVSPTPTIFDECSIATCIILDVNHTFMNSSVFFLSCSIATALPGPAVLNIMSSIIGTINLSSTPGIRGALIYMTDSTVNGDFLSSEVSDSGNFPLPYQATGVKTFPYSSGVSTGPIVLTNNRIGNLQVTYTQAPLCHWNVSRCYLRKGTIGFPASASLIFAQEVTIPVDLSLNFRNAFVVDSAVVNTVFGSQVSLDARYV